MPDEVKWPADLRQWQELMHSLPQDGAYLEETIRIDKAVHHQNLELFCRLWGYDLLEVEHGPKE